MSWRELLVDLEAQAESESERALGAEVADRTRRERSTLRLADRWTAVIGRDVALDLPVGDRRRGCLADVGPDWLLLVDRHAPDREFVVAASKVIAVRAAEAWAVVAEPSVAHRGPDLAWLLRRIARDRSTVRVVTMAGALDGTIDRVGADHLDLAIHERDDLRRSQHVRERAIVALGAIVVVERL